VELTKVTVVKIVL